MSDALKPGAYVDVVDDEHGAWRARIAELVDEWRATPIDLRDVDLMRVAVLL